MAIKEVTYYQAVCDKCKDVYEGGEFTAWGDHGMAIEDATNNGEWFDRFRLVRIEPPTEDYPRERRVYETVELLCRKCQTCDVCGDSEAYEMGDHLVCEDHEDHEFPEEVLA